MGMCIKECGSISGAATRARVVLGPGLEIKVDSGSEIHARIC
jgi:hypothetical protein